VCGFLIVLHILSLNWIHLITIFYIGQTGTNVDEAKVMIGSSGLKILPVDNLDEAAR